MLSAACFRFNVSGRGAVTSRLPFDGGELNYYRRFPGDYARDTKLLSLEEHGAYTLLLDHLYSTEAPISSLKDALKICTAHTKRYQNAVKIVLKNFFYLTDSGYRQKRVDEEIKYTTSKSNAAREAAKVRWNKDANALPTHSERIALPDSRLQTPEASVSAMQKLGVPLSLFLAYREVRERTHHPIISGAEDFIFTELLQFQQNGESPSDVLEQAVRTGSWKLVSTKRMTKGNAHDRQERTREAAKRAIQNIGSEVV